MPLAPRRHLPLNCMFISLMIHTEGETHQLVRCLWIWIFVFPVWEVLLFCAFRYFRSVIRKEKTAHATKEEGVPSVA